MSLALSAHLEFAPTLLLRLLPKQPHLHELSVTEMSEKLGWPFSKTRNFFGCHKNPYPEDIIWVSNRLGISVQELVEGMARYALPTWKEQQEKYMKMLDKLGEERTKIGEKQYKKSLYNMIKGRYPLS